jgi:hypothetical protein
MKGPMHWPISGWTKPWAADFTCPSFEVLALTLARASRRIGCMSLLAVGKWLARCYIAWVLANAT